MAVLLAAAVPAQAVARLGEPAPALRGAEWFQGEAIERFEPGTVYVLEFWATWCGYCIQAMPHLSELAERYAGRVVFVGVDVMERPPRDVDPEEWTSEAVAGFLATERGRKMTYRTLRDTADKHMEKSWMPAAVQADYSPGAIPMTFVVDAHGRLAWIGHPFAPEGVFDDVLESIVAGDFDTEAFAATKLAEREARLSLRRSRSEARAAELAPILEPLRDAVAAEDWPRVIAEAHKAIAADERTVRETFRPRLEAFRALLASDPAAACGLLGLEKSRAKRQDGPKSSQLADIAALFAET
ncbi:MAG: redoxin family protein, partial [Myxococcales bacterium]|nr:redoxin family protein [Myxococcales bacterium]